MARASRDIHKRVSSFHRSALEEYLVQRSEPIATMYASDLWPFALYFGVVIVIVGGMIGLSYVLGQRHEEAATAKPYESGIAQTGTARLRFDVKFYLNAMFFVIFDLEAAFIVAWAVAVRDVGWVGYIGAAIFIAVLLAALIYEWRLGALDWATTKRPRNR